MEAAVVSNGCNIVPKLQCCVAQKNRRRECSRVKRVLRIISRITFDAHTSLVFFFELTNSKL